MGKKTYAKGFFQRTVASQITDNGALRRIDVDDRKAESDPISKASDLILNQGKTIDEAVSLVAESYSGDAIDIRMNIPEETSEKASRDDRETRIITDISIDKNFKLIAIIFSDHNECCCENRCTPYLLTKSRMNDDVYSCQCSCGGWCTNGYEHPEEAIREYESMCEAEINRREEKENER